MRLVWSKVAPTFLTSSSRSFRKPLSSSFSMVPLPSWNKVAKWGSGWRLCLLSRRKWDIILKTPHPASAPKSPRNRGSAHQNIKADRNVPRFHKELYRTVCDENLPCRTWRTPSRCPLVWAWWSPEKKCVLLEMPIPREILLSSPN